VNWYQSVEALLGKEEAWRHLVAASSILLAPCLRSAALQLVQQQQGQELVMQLAGQLAEQLPTEWAASEGIDANVHCMAWFVPANLLGLAHSAAQQKEQQAASAGEALQEFAAKQAQQAARWAAVRLLPRLAAALQPLVAAEGAFFPQLVFESSESPTRCGVPDSLSNGVPAVHNVHQMRQLLAAVDAVLRMLPLCTGSSLPPLGGGEGRGEGRDALQAYMQRLRQQQLTAEEQVAQAAAFLSTGIAAFTLGSLQQCRAAIGRHGTKGLAAATPAARAMQGTFAAALPDALQLHTSACRLPFWLASLSPAQRQQLLPFLADWPGILEAVASAHEVARATGQAALAISTRGSERSQEIERWAGGWAGGRMDGWMVLQVSCTPY